MEKNAAGDASVTRQPGDDTVLREVVAKLIERYRRDAEGSKAADVDQSEMETVIMAPATGAGKATVADDEPMTETVLLSPAFLQPAETFFADDAAMTETVVLSTDSLHPAAVISANDAAMTETVLPRPSMQPAGASPADGAWITETVLLKPASTQSADAPLPADDAAITETVMLSPAPKSDLSNTDTAMTRPASLQPAGAVPVDDAPMTETVLLSPASLRKESVPHGDEAMTETVLIQRRSDGGEADGMATDSGNTELLETVLLSPSSKTFASGSCRRSGENVQPQPTEFSGVAELLETVMVAPRQARRMGSVGQRQRKMTGAPDE